MAEAVDGAQTFLNGHEHTVDQSLPKIVAYLLRFFLQLLMTTTSAMSATRTSRLKENWLLTKSKTGFVGYLFQNVPLPTLLLTATFFFFQFSVCLCRSFELLGFADVSWRIDLAHSDTPYSRWYELLNILFFYVYAVGSSQLCERYIRTLCASLLATASLPGHSFSNGTPIG